MTRPTLAAAACTLMLAACTAGQPAPQQREGRIRFGSVAATRMYCDGRMKLEADFSSRIGSFTRYRLDGHYLILQNNQGQSARFVAQDWD